VEDDGNERAGKIKEMVRKLPMELLSFLFHFLSIP
jgi:hypothetical protein